MSGADIRPDGRALIVRGYRNAWTWPIVPGRVDGHHAAAHAVRHTDTFHDERGGEAIGFLGNDGSYMSTGEVTEPADPRNTRL